MVKVMVKMVKGLGAAPRQARRSFPFSAVEMEMGEEEEEEEEEVVVVAPGRLPAATVEGQWWTTEKAMGNKGSWSRGERWSALAVTLAVLAVAAAAAVAAVAAMVKVSVVKMAVEVVAAAVSTVVKEGWSRRWSGWSNTGWRTGPSL
jgi:hypothetical protein